VVLLQEEGLEGLPLVLLVLQQLADQLVLLFALHNTHQELISSYTVSFIAALCAKLIFR
jgi:hypothetical protein